MVWVKAQFLLQLWLRSICRVDGPSFTQLDSLVGIYVVPTSNARPVTLCTYYFVCVRVQLWDKFSVVNLLGERFYAFEFNSYCQIAFYRSYQGTPTATQKSACFSTSLSTLCYSMLESLSTQQVKHSICVVFPALFMRSKAKHLFIYPSATNISFSVNCIMFSLLC